MSFPSPGASKQIQGSRKPSPILPTTGPGSKARKAKTSASAQRVPRAREATCCGGTTPGAPLFGGQLTQAQARCGLDESSAASQDGRCSPGLQGRPAEGASRGPASRGGQGKWDRPPLGFPPQGCREGDGGWSAGYRLLVHTPPPRATTPQSPARLRLCASIPGVTGSLSESARDGSAWE